ncbi:YqkE family protein [Sporosarcina sp. Te-1]|uniref:YqkE family protein n=1 Tax=Sporosarcina sp. Te-1 TaxID=2818390 RepID=UPI001A9E2F42|nr:YqkE family protein [Sporosarcina sp. Te-1]QTD42236.1 YqkE family protein [Sporosarcina sp. Te-1]
MAKKRQKHTQSNAVTKDKEDKLTLSDALNEEMLAKLKETKMELSAKAREEEEKRQEKLKRERLEKEKNKSFAELLDEYGDGGTKY